MTHLKKAFDEHFQGLENSVEKVKQHVHTEKNKPVMRKSPLFTAVAIAIIILASSLLYIGSTKDIEQHAENVPLHTDEVKPYIDTYLFDLLSFDFFDYTPDFPQFDYEVNSELNNLIWSWRIYLYAIEIGYVDSEQWQEAENSEIKPVIQMNGMGEEELVELKYQAVQSYYGISREQYDAYAGGILKHMYGAEKFLRAKSVNDAQAYEKLLYEAKVFAEEHYSTELEALQKKYEKTFVERKTEDYNTNRYGMFPILYVDGKPIFSTEENGSARSLIETRVEKKYDLPLLIPKTIPQYEEALEQLIKENDVTWSPLYEMLEIYKNTADYLRRVQ